MSLHHSPVKDWAAIVAAMLALLGTAWQATNSTSGRLSALEQYKDDTTLRLNRIDSKLDLLIDGMLNGHTQTQGAPRPR